MAGYADRLYVSKDGASTWSNTSVGATARFTEFREVSEDHYVVATAGDGVRISIDAGLSWSPANSGLSNLDVRGVVLTDGDACLKEFVIGTWGDGIWHAGNDLNWSPVDNSSARLFVTAMDWSQEAGLTFAAAEVDDIYRAATVYKLEPGCRIANFSYLPNAVESIESISIGDIGPFDVDAKTPATDLLFGTVGGGIFRVQIGSGVGTEAGAAPSTFRLSQNYPNPFSPTTRISYSVPQPGDVSLAVVDVLGRRVRLLASGAKPAGTYDVSFDATGLPSGVYFYVLRAGAFVETKRMLVVR